MNRDEQWNAYISIQENRVKAWVGDENEQADAYCFYLYDISNTKRGQSNWVRKSEYIFFIEEGGIYRVKIFRRRKDCKTTRITKYVDYYHENIKAEFQKFCESGMKYTLTAHLQPDFLYKMKHPYKDFAVIVSNKEKAISRQFLDAYHFKVHSMADDGQWIHILADELEKFHSDGILFSGLGKYERSFVFGEHDVDNPAGVNDQMIGNFTYVKKRGDCLEVGNDYFGTGKLYYYVKQDFGIISNNYHLLLLLLNDAGLKLEANCKMILALLCKCGQAFQQSITREREMFGTYMLTPDKMFEIKRGIVIKDKIICSVFQTEKAGEVSDYEYLLDEGRKEIIENTEIILADKRYETIVSDLTGGLDSRLVYGAISSQDAYKDKIVLHADGKENAVDQEDSDVSIAIKVNSIKKYDFNNVYAKYIWKDIEKAENEMMSLSALSGYYYPSSFTKIMITAKGFLPAFELNGFYGEICCRPYYSRTLLQKESNYEDIQTFITAVANRTGILSGSAYKALQEKLENELRLLPGDSFLEKWEMHYLFYRNGLHCNTIWEYEKNIPQWGPLQSKALFRYKHLTFGKIKDIHEQLHLIYSMEPELLRIPFEKKQDEEARKEFLKDVCGNEISDLDLKESYEEEKSRWKKQRSERRNHSSNEGEDGKDFHELWREGAQYDEQIEKRIYEILHKLMKYQGGVFQKLFGIAVFQALNEGRYSINEMKTLYQKLAAVYIQIQIFE